MSFYRRTLPHWQPDGVSIFVTWRLHGALPRGIRYTDLPASDGKRFLVYDRGVDVATSGPTWLKDPKVAAGVAGTLLIGETHWKLYELFAWVVMANHVHVLLKPHGPLHQITRAIKSSSAREANRFLNRSGQPFCQQESYDHWVRDGAEFDRIVRYIEWNPVHAGLVERVDQWEWSSASQRIDLGGSGPAPTR